MSVYWVVEFGKWSGINIGLEGVGVYLSRESDQAFEGGDVVF